MKKRVVWVDIFKALGIILIVVGHTWSPYVGYIYLFHVPAFFFISGYNSNFENYDFKTFFFKRIKSLLIPYFVFNFAFILLHLILKYAFLSHIFYQAADNKQFSLISSINNLLSINATEAFGGATWFLIVLFSAQLITFGVLSTIKRLELSKVYILVAAVFSLLCAHFLLNRHIVLTYLLDLTSVALFFVLTGYYIKQYVSQNTLKYYHFFTPIGMAIIFYFANYHFVPLDFPSRGIGHLYLVVLTSFSGIAFLYSLSILLEKVNLLMKPLTFIGRSTLWILCLHFFSFRLVFIVLYFLHIVPFSQLQQLIPPPHNTFWWIVSIGGVLIPLGIKWLLEKIVLIYKVFSRKKYYITVISVGGVVLAGIAANFWILGVNNFFYADDFGHFWFVKQRSIQSFLHFLPHQMYNDRPMGSLMLKVMLAIFGYNYQLHHALLLCIHLINALLVFLFMKQLLRLFKLKFSSLPFITALFFVAWPKSLMAVQWDGAIFDLLAGLLTLIFLNLSIFFIQSKKWAIGILSFIVYCLMLRTKENTLLIATLPIFILFLKQGREFFSKHFFKSNLQFWILGISILVMVIYFIKLLFLAANSHFMGYGPDSPYHSVFYPQILLRNLFRYEYLYLDFKSFDQTFYQYGKFIIAVVAFFNLAIFASIIQSKYRSLAFLSIVGIIIILLPVLPLINMQHRLYLYIPSIFFSMLIGICFLMINRLFRSELFIIFCAIGILIYVNFMNSARFYDTLWWSTIGKENRITFNFILYHKIPVSKNNVVILNVDKNTSIFNFGQGDVLRLVNIRNLEVKTFSSKEKPQYSKNAFVLDFRKMITK